MAVRDPKTLRSGAQRPVIDGIVDAIRGLYRKVSDTSISVGMNPASATPFLQAHLTVAQGGIAVDGLEGWHEIDAASEPQFQNSWVNFGGVEATAAFRKLPSGLVVLKGTVKLGNPLTSAAFTLPAGYRPLLQVTFANVVGTTVLGAVQIQADGDVVPNAPGAGSNAFAYINAFFMAEA